MPHFLLVGLNTEAEGQIHIGNLSRLYYNRYLENEFDFEDAKSYAFGLLKNDWKNNKSNILPNFAKKMIWAWQDDYIPIRYFLHDSGVKTNSIVKRFIFNFLSDYGAGVSQIIYIIILILATLGTNVYAKIRKLDLKFELILLIIFGYFCMILISEAQSRYKCLVMPFIIIISNFGIERYLQIREYMKKIIHKKLNIKDDHK